jgi:hypothetical protein
MTVIEALAIIRASWEIIDRIINQIQAARGGDIPKDKANAIRAQAIAAHDRLTKSLKS